MTRQEKFDRLFARMMLPENFHKRNPQMFSDGDTEIANGVADLRECLKVINNGSATVFDEIKFDKKYDMVIALLDEQGWK